MSTQMISDGAQPIPPSDLNGAARPAAPAQDAPPEAVLTQMAFGALLTQALYVAARLGVADLLAAGPRPVAELAAATGTHERSLYRVLRSLAGAGV
ncbi:MAG TPA: hypothetical protein VF611_20570, partial [Pyrinomonadaceae bacterium]